MAQKGIAPGQRDEIGNMAATAAKKMVDEVGLDFDGAQNVVEQGHLFADAMRQAAREAISSLRVVDYASEQVASNWGYPPEYVPKPLEEQVAILRGLWPKLSPGKSIAEQERSAMSEGAEALFAIPRWQALAASYNDALCNEVLQALASSRVFHNHRHGDLGQDRLRQSERTVRMVTKLEVEQDGDILIIPAQFGMLHCGKSVRRARVVFAQNEFGLGSFAVGAMALTHPTRFVRWEQLHVDCAGDEYDPDGDGRFVCAPYFNFHVGQLRLYTYGYDDARDDCGSASGFLPQAS